MSKFVHKQSQTRSPQHTCKCTYRTWWKSVDITQVIVRKRKYRCVAGRQLSKIDEICQLAIPNQSSTISIHTSFVRMQWHLLKLSSGKRTDARQTDGRTERENIIPRHYRVAEYKKVLWPICQALNTFIVRNASFIQNSASILLFYHFI